MTGYKMKSLLVSCLLMASSHGFAPQRATSFFGASLECLSGHTTTCPSTGRSVAPLYSAATQTTSSPSHFSNRENATDTDGSSYSDYRQERRRRLMEARTRRVNGIAYTNAAVVGALAVIFVYNLFHVDIEALLALWEYDLGKHVPGSISKSAVALDLLARLPSDAIQSYQDLVATNPIYYKAWTSGVAYSLGDFISQVYQGRRWKNLDLPRSFRSGAAGFIGHGPLCHYWLLTMETYLDFDGAWWATGLKVTADLTVWSIFLNAAYSFIIGMLQFRDPKDVWKDVQATSWPALRSAWRFWPFVHTVSFSHAVPLDLKLLWVDCMEVVWVTILSKVANEDKNAKMADDPNLEVEKVDECFGTRPDTTIEMTRAEEFKKSKVQLAFELPQKVLSACWPLVVMWPVLYAGYQLELALGLVSE